MAQSGEAETSGPASAGRAQATSAAGSRGLRVPARNPGGAGANNGGIRFQPRDRAGGGGILSGGTLPSRTLVGILGGILVLLVLLVFALNRGGDDTADDGGLTPTSTVESVLNPPAGQDGTNTGAASTPAGGESTEPSATQPPADGAPEPTGDDTQPRQGGDNQLNPPDDPTETPAASTGDPLARKPALHGVQ